MSRASEFEMELKSMQQQQQKQRKKEFGNVEMGNSSNAIWFNNGQVQRMSTNNCAEKVKMKRREEEKAEMLWHLVYWGPN